MLDEAVRRVDRFCAAYAMRAPILMAPMAGACPPALAVAVSESGGMGGCGALLMDPDAIAHWAAEFRAATKGPFQMNLWVPDPTPVRNADHERSVLDFLESWGPRPADLSADISVPFTDQCAALIEARPAAMSSIMGLFPPDVVDRMKASGIRWFATATTVAEALQAEAAGADAIIAQGSEAGGHRGAFDAEKANAQMCGLMALVPAIRDAVDVPVIATGGIADARGIVAALALGASAVQLGTAFLRTPEAAIAPAWADALARTQPEDTAVTRAFSGRLGRSLRTGYVAATERADTITPLPYPLQRLATGPMRADGARDNDLARIQAWAGHSARLAPKEPAGEIVRSFWSEARAALFR